MGLVALSRVPCIARKILNHWTIREVLEICLKNEMLAEVCRGEKIWCMGTVFKCLRKEIGRYSKNRKF